MVHQRHNNQPVAARFVWMGQKVPTSSPVGWLWVILPISMLTSTRLSSLSGCQYLIPTHMALAAAPNPDPAHRYIQTAFKVLVLSLSISILSYFVLTLYWISETNSLLITSLHLSNGFRYLLFFYFFLFTFLITISKSSFTAKQWNNKMAPCRRCYSGPF